MLHTIRTIFESLLCRLLPARGQHRSADAPLTPELPDTPTLAIPCVPAEQRLLRGEDVAFLRPYVLTPQERQERRLQRGRRRALWLATYDVEAGPRWIHGLEVGC
ncbi:hypothetical protein MOV08_17720 [Streptomyces yunnanensis]|uniref:Uncharacterized protein n=1 Tax=Streptomyces yunnanensis TaxID=156453 RepID=A0ABY8AB80_9ACTN|nr:hypothetical protein [Streptomyces yunnanensis]WEB40937.1 hypothetical protein MOV08_17720 [Streptomyces yunnanensis]